MERAMELFSCDWGGKAGKWWECWRCDPCCGDPWDPLHAIYCFLCFCTPAALITWPFVCAEDLDQDCAFGNHFLPIFVINVLLANVIPCTTWSCIRHNRRVKYARMEPGCPNKIGDTLLTCPCCLPCTLCQVCRSMERDQWNWPKKCAKQRCCKICICPCRMDATLDPPPAKNAETDQKS